MEKSQMKTGWSARNIIIVAIVLSVIVGAITGYATAYFIRGPLPASTDRTIYLFTTTLNFNESKAETAFNIHPFPHDYFAPDRITVNRGDKVTIRYYNTEDEPENHTFTMSYSSYNFDYLLQFQQEQDVKFNADTAGVFTFICTLHRPTMTGYLVVLG